MLKQVFDLWKNSEYDYPVTGKFRPTIHSYIHEEDETVRPAIVVVPGGGYRIVAPSEGEMVAAEFYDRGYNTFVVTYTTNMTDMVPLKFQPLKDLSRAVRIIRKNAAGFCVDADRVTVCGFSAGGHLTGSLAVHFNAPELEAEDEYKGVSNRPDAVILSYPVITTGEYAHKDSFIALLGREASQEELDYMSLEAHVSSTTPPAFLWQTAADAEVPVENSCLYAAACREKGIDFEHHIFSGGFHGMSLANEQWANAEYGGYYTMDQTADTLQMMADQGIPLPAPFDSLGEIPAGKDMRGMIESALKQFSAGSKPDAAVALWPELADLWMHRVL